MWITCIHLVDISSSYFVDIDMWMLYTHLLVIYRGYGFHIDIY